MKTLILLLGLTLSFGGHQKSCKHSETDFKALSCAIYFEARGATKVDKVSTAFVAINRVENKKFPKSIRKVIYAPGAFSWTDDAYITLIPKEERAWKEAQRIAMLVLNDRVDDPTNGQVYFGRTKMKYMKRVTLKTRAHVYGK